MVNYQDYVVLCYEIFMKNVLYVFYIMKNYWEKFCVRGLHSGLFRHLILFWCLINEEELFVILFSIGLRIEGEGAFI